MNTLLKYTAASSDEGKTVETVWRRKFSISSTLFKDLKSGGKIKKNGEICRSVDIVSKSDILTADVSENAASESIVPVDIPLDIIYEDDFLMVINKPRNMSVHPSQGNRDNTLANGVIFHWQKNNEMHKFHAVNRIDKDTSGICVVAKNRFAHGVLSKQIKCKEFRRRYMAMVHGILADKSGTIDKPIKRDSGSVIKRVTSPDGKAAVTHYKVIEEYENVSLVEIYLETGRTHQIRVHFSDMGHPLIGDWLYGNGDNERDIAKGHLLHAYYAEFYHPLTNELMKFDLPMPEDMNLFDKLCKLNYTKFAF